MKKTTFLLIFMAVLYSFSTLGQNSKISGKFVIDRMVKFEDGIKTIDIDVAKSGECLYYYTFFNDGRFVLTGYDDVDCIEEIRSNGFYIVFDNVLTLNLDGDMESYYIESYTANQLVLYETYEESRGFGGSVVIKNQYIYKKV